MTDFRRSFAAAADDIQARHKRILGKPPRIAPVDRATAADDVLAATSRLRGGIVGDATPLPLDAIPEIMFTLCRVPALWEKVMALSIQMQGENGLLPARDRQLVILRTAWLLGAPYEWGEHVAHSRKAGLSVEDIERVTLGSAAQGWTAHEQALLLATEELRQNAMVSDESWEQLARHYDARQLVELLVLVGQFTTIAYLQNGLRLRLEPGNRGLAAR